MSEIVYIGVPDNRLEDIRKLLSPIEVVVMGWKGKSECTVELLEDKTFEVMEYRKDSKDDDPEPKPKYVSQVRVNMMWKAIENLEKNNYPKHRIPSRELGKEICRLWNLTDNHLSSKTLKFSWNAFYGERNDYNNVYYYPIKVLQYYYKLVEHGERWVILKKWLE